MPTFSIQTLGCKVNQYESEQMASLLRAQGWVEGGPDQAELHIVNTCSVTVDAASKSRQTVRRAVRQSGKDPRVIVAGCWATSDKEAAGRIPGVGLVVTHHDDVAAKLAGFLKPVENATQRPSAPGTRSLPLLDTRQSHNQRAFLKIQDGCDAHCTYCIIPTLRPIPWSKPIDDLLLEARQLVDAGHVELVLTGIFLGAYGQETALRRRQSKADRQNLAHAIESLCTKVPGLRRVRLSSLEPGDLDDELLSVLRSHSQVVQHFHLPLQSGSDAILRKMNRQYRRDDFLRLIDRLGEAFDRPALTTDIIAGFPGENEGDFEETVEVAERARFIHIHSFPFSPRPGTAAARWTESFVRGPVVNQRIDRLRDLAAKFSFEFRSTFVGQTVQVLVEREQSKTLLRHGRCERYFDVHFESDTALPGDLVTLKIDRVTPTRTFAAPGNRTMIAVLQRVSQASVTVADREIARIGSGILALVSVHADDRDEDISWTARKLATLRMFAEGEKNFERDVLAIGGSILLVSNFTIAAETAKGRRPSLGAAASPAVGREKFDQLVTATRALVPSTQIGEFGADMKVMLVNDGPVTFLLNSREK